MSDVEQYINRVKCILRYISQERGGGTNHKDTKDTKIDRSYSKFNLSHRT